MAIVIRKRSNKLRTHTQHNRERESKSTTHGYRNIGNLLYVIGIQNLNFNINPLYAITVTPNCHKFLSYNQKYARQYDARGNEMKIEIDKSNRKKERDRHNNALHASMQFNVSK